MLKNNLKIAARSIRKQRLTGILNIFGLALGIAVALLLYLYVQDENSFNKFNSNYEQLYRTVLTVDDEKWAGTPNIVGPTMTEKIPGIKRFTRLLAHDFGGTAFIKADERNYAEQSMYWADKDLFQLFDIQLITGDPKTALSEPNQIVISETIAEKYFGKFNPMGEIIVVDDRQNMTVTGVFKDLPTNSTLDGDIFGSFSTYAWAYDRLNWGNASFETWFLLEKNTELPQVQEQIAKIHHEAVAEEDRWFTIGLQAMRDVHFGSTKIEQDSKRGGDPLQVRILGILALVVLLIACINYMNLATAQSQKRFREVGISKTLGANRSQLIKRFFTETTLVVSVAFLLAFVIASFTLPYFNELAVKTFSIQHLLQPNLLIAIGITYLSVIFLAGLYPAFYLSSFSPKELLQTTFNKKDAAGRFRQWTVVTQFTASIILIISTLAFYQQLNYIQNKKLGFHPEQVIALNIAALKEQSQINTLKESLRNMNGVESVCLSQSYPTADGESGYSLARSIHSEEYIIVNTNQMSADCSDILNFNLLAGRGLPPNRIEGDTVVKAVVNQYVSEYLGWQPEEAIGKEISLFGNRKTEVVGVVEDFHFTSLHQPIGPYVLHNGTMNHEHYILLNTTSTQYSSLIGDLQSTFSSIAPQVAFQYNFLDESINNLYAKERRLAKIVLLFSVLAILVACLGLFGLATFMAEQRTKEIGIRKVLGASIENLVGLLTKEFLMLVGIALVLAIPLGWYAMNQWLQGFAYRTELSWQMFVIAGAIALGIAFLTVSMQSLRAALVNPVESLKDE